jgi:HAD superfamily hydrolase (TIGR01509 family)
LRPTYTSRIERIAVAVDSPVVTALEPAAILWDMDGTIVDTEPYWMSAETELVDSFGGSWTHDDALTVVGSGLWHSARLLQKHGVSLGEDEIVDNLTDRVLDKLDRAVPWRPGAVELLAESTARGVPAALVTMSIKRMAERIAAALPGAPFSVIVSGDDVENSKPHPEAYVTAARLLGVSAAECVAIEDSVPGIAAAVASGAVVIGIPLHASVPDDMGHTVWDSLEGKTLDTISELYRSERHHE